MIYYGLQIKHVQDERSQHALLVRPATGSEWRVYIRHYSFHVVFAAAGSLQSSIARHGWEAGDFLELPVASFRKTKRGRCLTPRPQGEQYAYLGTH